MCLYYICVGACFTYIYPVNEIISSVQRWRRTIPSANHCQVKANIKAKLVVKEGSVLYPQWHLNSVKQQNVKTWTSTLPVVIDIFLQWKQVLESLNQRLDFQVRFHFNLIKVTKTTATKALFIH